MLFDDLRNIQRNFGHLAKEPLRSLSEQHGVPLYQIHSAASFYPQFRLSAHPPVRVGVCADMSCHLRGAEALRKSLAVSAVLKDAKHRQSGPAPQIQVNEVSCLGQCDRAPAVAVNGHIFSNVTAPRVNALISAALAGERLAEAAAAPSPPRFASDPYHNEDRYGALRNVCSMSSWDDVIPTLKSAGLVGMGGAGFPTSIKWDTVRNTPADHKYVVCNADESEPGTVKDRCIMEHLPHLVIEGMILCGLVTGAENGILYIRHEYEHQALILEAEIARCREARLLGQDILGSGRCFDIDVFTSPGGYICGEGSALLEAIEGKRAEPRLRPPNTATHGLWQKPTALNNVETFALVPQIVARGVRWYKSQGLTETAAGLKFVSVSGDVQNPGVFEVRMGTPLSKVILDFAGGPPKGKKIKAFSPSGAAAGFLPPSFLDVRLDFQSMAAAGTMLGSGAIVVCAEGRCMLDMALNSVKFFRNESCGKCVPCRVGSQKMVDLLTNWTQGNGRMEDITLVKQLSETLAQTSICGLGQFIPYSILTVLKHFQHEVFAHLFHRTCPDEVCPMRA